MSVDSVLEVIPPGLSLILDFSPSAYTTDTQLSRFKQILHQFITDNPIKI